MPSQLKYLKESLHANGFLNQSRGKKQKAKSDRSLVSGSQVERKASLHDIREKFNPFEFRAPSRRIKFDSAQILKENVQFRPGLTKQLGDQRRREALSQDLTRRTKVGSLHDRRFGENDPSISAEERTAERFAKEAQKKAQKGSSFDLDDDDRLQLTHLGSALFDPGMEEVDFQRHDMPIPKALKLREKRKHEDVEDGDGSSSSPEEFIRKKSKHEVMKEVIAKSKYHKFERQKAKEDDDELRETLDGSLPNVFSVMGNMKSPSPHHSGVYDSRMHPERSALQGKEDEISSRQYDQRLKQLTFDKRSRPVDRTRTAEEVAIQRAEHFQRLEDERLHRMENSRGYSDENGEEESEEDDSKEFGLYGTYNKNTDTQDEDDFIIDSDLVESDSEASLVLDDVSVDDSAVLISSPQKQKSSFNIDKDLPFLPADSALNDAALDDAKVKLLIGEIRCPETHDEFLETLKSIDVSDIPSVVQYIRKMYHPNMHGDHKGKLARFSQVLVKHVAHLANQKTHPPFPVLENLFRHIHSLAKDSPNAVSKVFKGHIRDVFRVRPLCLVPGDLIILSGIMTMFPTSDRFHALVTPSMLIMTRYLSQSRVESLRDLTLGGFIATLCLEAQTISTRFIPEVIDYSLHAICLLSPIGVKFNYRPLLSPVATSLQIRKDNVVSNVTKPRLWEFLSYSESVQHEDSLKISLLGVFVSLINTSVHMWVSTAGFCTILSRIENVIGELCQHCRTILPSALYTEIRTTLDTLRLLLKQSSLSRRPLLLHSHRPQPIRAAVPKFEESFNPYYHYDPDHDRAEVNKLKREHKREHKSALRELRKDSYFITRETLQESRGRDIEYNKNYRRLIAEIQNGEGKEANSYIRGKQTRQKI